MSPRRGDIYPRLVLQRGLGAAALPEASIVFEENFSTGLGGSEVQALRPDDEQGQLHFLLLFWGIGGAPRPPGWAAVLC